MKIEGLERRTFGFEFRADGDDEDRTISGYGALFNTLSENLGGFREKIEPGAFDDVLQDDVRALFNHNPDKILARTQTPEGKDPTLNIGVDATGLNYSFGVPDTSYARDLVTSIDRGDISQSSFAFIVADDRWEEDEEGRLIRTILKIARLFDVSPVTYPGYADTTVAARAMQDYQNQQLSVRSQIEQESRERELYLHEHA